MDASMQDQQQKDFLSSLFPTMDMSMDMQNIQNNRSSMDDNINPQEMSFHYDSQMMNSGSENQMASSQSANDNLSQVNTELINNLMSMHQEMAHSPTSPITSTSSQLIIEQVKLQQLQQLQQLQNQIFQQQMALMNGGRNNPRPQEMPIDSSQEHPSPYLGGLPTPGPSTELRAQHPNMEYVSPMILNYTPRSPYPESSLDEMMAPSMHAQHSSPYGNHRGSTSAPAHIAFNSSHHIPSDLELDISPLTSPWLGANPNPSNQSSISHHHNKRTASASGEEDVSTRKKQSPAVRPSLTGPTRTSRGSRSTNSTPLLRSRRGSVGIVQDSPSPVDLSMPMSSSNTPTQLPAPSTSHIDSMHLTPVTPAMIMNMGNGHTSRPHPPQNGSDMSPPPPPIQPASDPKGKGPAGNRSKTGRKLAAVSPPLKAILPAGASNPRPQAQPVVQVKKSSHKAAEQKRRDSLKTTFDDLRMLLPPIPLPSDGDRYAGDEIASLLATRPLLPGALPPRGPPKAGGDGPNKGVSKLQLLICGNEYIRLLRGRVERRDEEISRLRSEIRRLREEHRDVMENEEIDLDKDIDAVELLSVGFARDASIACDDDDYADND